MDRLSAVAVAGPHTITGALALALVFAGGAGCGERTATRTGPAPSRVNAVAKSDAPPEPKLDLDAFCDQRPDPGSAKAFSMPPLSGPDADPKSGKSWRWVNVWATWCKPCVEELPLLAELRPRLQTDGVAMDIAFLSVDAEAADVDSFRQKHPKIPETLRIANVDALGPWLQSIGLDESTALPVHLFLDPQRRVRCVRTGQVAETDYPAVKGLVAQGV